MIFQQTSKPNKFVIKEPGLVNVFMLAREQEMGTIPTLSSAHHLSCIYYEDPQFPESFLNLVTRH